MVSGRVPPCGLVLSQTDARMKGRSLSFVFGNAFFFFVLRTWYFFFSVCTVHFFRLIFSASDLSSGSKLVHVNVI